MNKCKEDFSEVLEFIDDLPRFTKFNHEKLYFKVFDKVEKMGVEQREKYSSFLPDLTSKTEKKIKKLNQHYKVYGILAPVLSIVSISLLGVNDPVSYTCMTLLLILFVHMIFSGVYNYRPLRILLIYSRLISDVIEDLRKNRSKEEMKKTFELLDDLTKML